MAQNKQTGRLFRHPDVFCQLILQFSGGSNYWHDPISRAGSGRNFKVHYFQKRYVCPRAVSWCGARGWRALFVFCRWSMAESIIETYYFAERKAEDAWAASAWPSDSEERSPGSANTVSTLREAFSSKTSYPNMMIGPLEGCWPYIGTRTTYPIN